jgi:hypothetical protein
MTYKILYTDGREVDFIPANGKKPTLQEMQKIVGGLIERVSVIGGEMWLNEDGLGLQLPLNHNASILATKAHNYPMYIVGDVLLCTRKKRKA